MRYVDYWGEVYRFSERNYERFVSAGLKAKRAGADAPLPNECGGKYVGRIDFRSVDAGVSDFEGAVERLQKDKADRKAGTANA